MLPLKLFSIVEANRILPVIQSALTVFFTLREETGQITKDMELLFSIWGEDVLRKTNIDYHLYLTKEQQRKDTLKRMKGALDSIASLGAIVKDINHGLVDFYAEHNGKMVLLCWQYGEEAVSYWHGVDEGYTGRKSISMLQA